AEIDERENRKPEESAARALFVNEPQRDPETRRQHGDVEVLHPCRTSGRRGGDGNLVVGFTEIGRWEAGLGEGGDRKQREKSDREQHKLPPHPGPLPLGGGEGMAVGARFFFYAV